MSGKFSGKVAIITGGSAGIGLATAKRFVDEGMEHVFITGRRQDALDAAVKRIGRNVTGVQGDVSNLADLDRLYAEVAKQKRRIDIVFANAGVSRPGLFGEVDEAAFDFHFDANVKGLFFTVQKALPLMNDGGSVILNGSIASYKGYPAFSVYSATKAALTAFVRGWTVDLKDRKIRVNLVHPGHTDTEILESLAQGDALVQMKQHFVDSVPLSRMAEADDIARAVSYLASDESSYVTGIALTVDGGVAQI